MLFSYLHIIKYDVPLKTIRKILYIDLLAKCSGTKSFSWVIQMKTGLELRKFNCTYKKIWILESLFISDIKIKQLTSLTQITRGGVTCLKWSMGMARWDWCGGEYVFPTLLTSTSQKATTLSWNFGWSDRYSLRPCLPAFQMLNFGHVFRTCSCSLTKRIDQIVVL